MEIVKFIEEQLEEFDFFEETNEPTMEQPVLWFVKYKTVFNDVKYLPCEGIELAREYANKLNGQIMNVML